MNDDEQFEIDLKIMTNAYLAISFGFLGGAAFVWNYLMVRDCQTWLDTTSRLSSGILFAVSAGLIAYSLKCAIAIFVIKHSTK